MVMSENQQKKKQMKRMMKFYCQPLTAISDLNNNPHIPKDRMPIASGGGIVKLHFIHHFPAAK